MKLSDGVFIHKLAQVDVSAAIGARSRIWENAQVMEKVSIGEDCSICRGSVLGAGTRLGHRVVVDNYANLLPAIVEDEAFIGPLACVISNANPRSVDTSGKRREERQITRDIPLLKRGCSIGAGSMILPGVIIGRYATVCAGSVVSKAVPDNVIVAGNPARPIGYACRCGLKLDAESLKCPCGIKYTRTGGAHEDTPLIEDDN